MLLVADRLTLDFQITVAGAAAAVEWYLEYASDPSAASFFQEVAEEAAAGGIVHMPKIVRDFQEHGGAGLAIGTHFLDVQLVRRHQFVRLQMRCTTGGATASVLATAPFGMRPAKPA